MKILLINNVIDKGSTGKIVRSLFNEFSKQNETFLIFGRGSKKKENNIFRCTLQLESKIHHLVSMITGNMYGGMLISTFLIKRKIKHLKPDVINLHCLNGYFVNIYGLLKWLAKKKYKTVLTMHADFMMTGGCGYSIDCKKYLTSKCKKCSFYKNFNSRISLNRAGCNYNSLEKSILLFKKDKLKIICVSPWLAKRYQESPIYSSFYVYSVLNPINDYFFEPGHNNPYKCINNILYVTPDINDSVKSGFLINEVAKLRKDLHFTIICSKETSFDVKSENITYISGGVTQKELRDYYYFADGTLLLSKRETFSMVVAESLACGTPVYGFKCGGPETITINEFSLFFDYGEIQKLSNSLLSIIKDTQIREKAKIKYSSNDIATDYLKIINGFF